MIELKQLLIFLRCDCLRFIAIFLALCLVVNTSTVNAREHVEREVTATEQDYTLRDAFYSRDPAKFDNTLDEGGDPTAWFENSIDGWVFCAAAEKGLEVYLQLIIDKGFNVNFRQTGVHATASLPLSCAVRFDNLRALEMLISAGADPAVRMCADCYRRAPGSVLDEAAIVGKYHLAVWLLDKGNYSDAQIETVILGLERFPVDESNPRNAMRLNLAELIRERGFEVNPWTKEKIDVD